MSLSIQQLKRSAWARRFKAACPSQYDEALVLAQNTGMVRIEQRDDHCAKGDFTWAVIPEANPEFWLDGLPTRSKAVALCARMDWPVQDGQDDKMTEIKLSDAQLRVLKWLGNGWKSEPGAGMAIHVNGKRICNVDTMFALMRAGLVEQVLVHGREAIGQWQVTEAGKALAGRLWP